MRLYIYIFSKDFLVLALRLRSLIHFEVVFVYGVRWGIVIHSFA